MPLAGNLLACRYGGQRRRVTPEHVQTATTKNKNAPEAKTEVGHARFRDETRSAEAVHQPLLRGALAARPWIATPPPSGGSR